MSDFARPWMAARQVPLSTTISWSLLHCDTPLPKLNWALLGWHTEFIHITNTFDISLAKKCGGKTATKIKQY